MTPPALMEKAGETRTFPVLAEQHQSWAAARARLDGPTPAPKAVRPRPVSPFIREAKERMEAASERAQQILDEIGDPLIPSADWREIAKEVALKHGVKLIDLVSPRRDHWTVVARHEVMWRCKQETMLSLPQIGRRLGNRDHTTVLHGIKKHAERMREAAGG